MKGILKFFFFVGFIFYYKINYKIEVIKIMDIREYFNSFVGMWDSIV